MTDENETEPKRPPGRPPLDPGDDSARIGLVLPAALDRWLAAAAARRGLSVSAFVRFVLRKHKRDSNSRTND